MDFFEKQHTAKKNSKFLYSMFFLVVILSQLSVGYVVGSFTDEVTLFGKLTHAWSLSAILINVVMYIIGCVIEWKRLAGGGKAIATRMRAKPLYQLKAQDALNQAKETEETLLLSQSEKKLLQVVENMSLASGVSAPYVYVLPEEQGINAFVAGTKARDTVLVVTQGTLDNLTENELYAVIGHEFSHIAHGDTTQNMTLLILMGGFLAFFSLGSEISSFASDTGKYDNSLHAVSGPLLGMFLGASSQESTLFKILIFILGVSLMMFSSVGIIFARLFKYAFLRQREYLADASSVQYTRSHDLLSVLDKLADKPEHGGIYHQNIETFSHLFFANAVPEMYLGNILSTHPPVEKRIKAISEQSYEILKIKKQVEIDKEKRLFEKTGMTAEQRRHEEIKEIRKENLFEYREKSDYDGKPIDFIQDSLMVAPAMLKVKKNKVQPKPEDIKVMPALRSKEIAQSEKHDCVNNANNSNGNSNSNIIEASTESHTIIDNADKFLAKSSLELSCKNTHYVDSLTAIMDTSKGCLELIAGVLACHQQSDISPLDYEISVEIYEQLQKEERDNDIPKLILALDTLAEKSFKIDIKTARLYMNRLIHIAGIDHQTTLLEHLLLDRIAFQIGLVPDIDIHDAIAESEIAFAFTMLANAFLIHDNHAQSNRKQILQRMQKLLDIEDSAWQSMTKTKLNISECLSTLAQCHNTLKHNIVNTLETVMLADGKLCTDEQYMLQLLHWRLELK